MSAASDRHEKAVADAINGIPGCSGERPAVSTGYSDVLITEYKYKRAREWVEVKMNHTDNLSNPRAFYKNGRWQTTYKTPAAKAMVDELNRSSQTKQFIKKISDFSGIPERAIIIATSKSMLKEEGAVPLHVMKSYFDQPSVNRYIMSKENYDLGQLVTDHYTIGKEEPAYYMQAADDFYLISRKNPLSLPNNIPVLKGIGDFKVRIGTRSQFYEVQAEIKIKSMPNSNYSLLESSKKMNPLVL